MPLNDFPIVVELPVLWSDQDIYGHVNNVVYLRWFESARVKYWDDGGIRLVMAPHGWGPILAAVHCNYRDQLKYPDTVWIGTRVVTLGRTSIRMEHQVFSQECDTIVADGESLVVLFNYREQHKTEITKDLQDAIEALEKRPFTRTPGR